MFFSLSGECALMLPYLSHCSANFVFGDSGRSWSRDVSKASVFGRPRAFKNLGPQIPKICSTASKPVEVNIGEHIEGFLKGNYGELKES